VALNHGKGIGLTQPPGSFGFVSTIPAIVGVSATAQAWSSTNRAYFHRVTTPAVINTLAVYIGTSSGNISFGVYAGVPGRNNPGASKWVSGAVASPGTGDRAFTMGSTVQVDVGDWIGMTADNTTITTRAGAPGGGAAETWMNGLIAYQDTAHPLTAGTPAVTGVRFDRLIQIIGYYV
jgi:hypothetical protein